MTEFELMRQKRRALLESTAEYADQLPEHNKYLRKTWGDVLRLCTQIAKEVHLQVKHHDLEIHPSGQVELKLQWHDGVGFRYLLGSDPIWAWYHMRDAGLHLISRLRMDELQVRVIQFAGSRPSWDVVREAISKAQAEHADIYKKGWER